MAHVFEMLGKILPPLLFLASGVIAWQWLGKPVEKPKPVQVAELPIKAEVMELQPTDYQIWIESQGIVRAHYETTVTPLVAGVIVSIHSCFEDGAYFSQNDILAELDPADFQATLSAAEARLARAEAQLSQEQARSKQARLNWEDIGYEDEPSPLVLRVPQLKEAEASVKSSLADVDQARRNLERTKIRAPFAGRVKSRGVGLGQAVGASTALGVIFATDWAEVRLPIAPSQLSHVKLPTQEKDTPVEVELLDALNLSSAITWKASIIRTEGTLDNTTRELFAIARIEDPFGLQNPAQTQTPLRIGQPVRARIKGEKVEKAFVIPRTAMRGLNRVMMVLGTPPKLLRRTILPYWTNQHDFVAKEGFVAGETLCLSPLTYAPDGATVEIVQPAPADSAAEITEKNTSAADARKKSGNPS